MFTRIGRFAAGNARAVLVTTLLVVIAAAAFGFTAFGKLLAGGFEDPSADSTVAAQLIGDRFGGRADLVLLVDAGSSTVDDPAVAQAGAELTARLRADSRLTQVSSYFDTVAPPLRSDDGRYAMAVAYVGKHNDQLIKDLRADYGGQHGPLSVTVGGAAAVGVDVGHQVGADLVLAEAIAVPLILVLLLFAFGSVVAALLPLAIGAIAIFGTFAELSVLGSVTDVSIYSVNLTTALGLGLAIDYALLMVSRFREETGRGLSTEDAVVNTVRTAGRTIVFSATTVAAALAVMLLFPLYFLRSFAYAGIGVLVIAVVSSLVVLPAMLAVIGTGIDRGRLPWAKGVPSTASPFWGRVAAAVSRRPVLAAVPVVAVLLMAAAPLLHAQFGTPDDRVLPTSADTRVIGDALRAHFPSADTGAIDVVTTGPLAADALAGYAGELSALPGVTSVVSSAGTFAHGSHLAGSPADAAMGNPGAQRLSVVPRAQAKSAAAQDLVRAVRAAPAPVAVKVGGDAATLVDSKDAIGSRLPLAFVLIALSTFVLLFLFTGSLLQPVRALVFNVLGLSATLGIVELVFQQGWLSSVLGFTPLPLDTSMLVLLFCIAFGLSMDYEVFVLSRVKENHDAGLSPVAAVTNGLSRSGRIVSTAAVLLAVSFFAFGTSGLSFLQLFGIGAGLAVLIDATLIRGVLVPAGMALLGRAAWWAPAPLRRLHGRIGLREAESPRPIAERTPVRV